MILSTSKIDSLSEIKNTIPSFYFKFADYMAVQKFIADEMDEYAALAIQVINNAFILKCDDNTLDVIQAFLKLSDIKLRISNRGVYLNSYLTSIGKLSVSKLKKLLEVAIDETPNIYFETTEDGYRVLVFDFEDNNKHNIIELITLVSTRLPAGMRIRIHQHSISEPYETGASQVFIGLITAHRKSFHIPMGITGEISIDFSQNNKIHSVVCGQESSFSISLERNKDAGWN